MRALVAVIIALGLLGTAAEPADAKRGVKAKKAPVHHHQRYSLKSRRFNPHNPKCVDAEALDPGGNYADFPCWARAAFAPKGDDGWR